MEMIKKYAGILMMLTLLVGFTSCESEDETEFNLPGEWYTNEEIDFGAYTWGRGTLMTFNARNQGTLLTIMEILLRLLRETLRLQICSYIRKLHYLLKTRDLRV